MTTRTKYASADPHGYAFVPLSVETYGRWGQPAMKLLSALASAGAATRGVTFDPSAFVTFALRELSMALCRGNGLLFRRGQGACAKAAGHAFRAGAVAPYVDVA